MNTLTPYVTVAQAAATVRAALKARGWTSRQISVRSDQYSGGSAIDVRVKDMSIRLSDVKEIAYRQERIRYDHLGEILSGSNRFVSVDYDHAAVEVVAAPIAAMIAAMPVGDVAVFLQVQVRVTEKDAVELTDLVSSRALGDYSFTARGAADVIVCIAADRK